MDVKSQGDRAVVAGGAISGSIIISGSNNTVRIAADAGAASPSGPVSAGGSVEYDAQDPVLLVTSKNESNRAFGTGFVVACDGAGSHVLTCAHVISDLDGPSSILAAKRDARVVQSGDPDFLDVALLYVPGLKDRSALPLKRSPRSGDTFVIRGFQRRSANYQYKPIPGKLEEPSWLISGDEQEKVALWDLGVEGQGVLQFGYSGAPVIDDRTGGVIGLASEKVGNGKQGIAIAIASVSRWLEEIGPLQYVEANLDHQAVAINNVAAVGEGLNALTILMREPAIRTTVTCLQSSFRVTQIEIDRVTNFKFVHAQLHRLQLDCCDMIAVEVGYFPENLLSHINLERYGETLADILDRLRKLATRPNLADHLTWIPALERACGEYQEALRVKASERLETANHLLRRVPAVYLPQLNTRLIDAAAGLKLDGLAGAMQQIEAHIPNIPGTSRKLADKFKRFSNGRLALSRLNTSLNNLIAEHNSWQDIDIQLRLVEPTLVWDVASLENSWLDIKAQAEPLFASSVEAWALHLASDTMQLDRSMAARDLEAARSAFVRYRRRITWRFMSVDSSLESICDELRGIGSGIGDVLGGID